MGVGLIAAIKGPLLNPSDKNWLFDRGSIGEMGLWVKEKMSNI